MAQRLTLARVPHSVGVYPSHPSEKTDPRARRGLTALVLALALVGATGGSCTVTSASDPTAPATPTAGAAGEAGSRLALLKIAEWHSMAGYSRDKFPHWAGQGGGCDTRDAVLKRDGKNVQATADCKITAGSWYSVYDKKTFTVAGELDVDHMVPLANAWRTGAADWNNEKRGEFANDITRPQLIAVSASSNRSKGDQDPSEWKPPNQEYWCEYAQRWIAVKHYWQLSVTRAEKTSLTRMLAACRT